MTRSQLVEAVIAKHPDVPKKDIELIVELIFSTMATALTRDERVEIRGLGSFSVRVREARTGRNPKTGAKVSVARKRIPFFSIGKELRARVDSKRI
jgi:integration host factor subunit beta